MKEKVVQNKQPAVEDIQPVIDEKIVDTVHEIFEAVIGLNALDNLFMDLANRLIDDLKANSLMEFNLELTDDQKDQLRKAVQNRGQDTVKGYLEKLNSDGRTKLVYGIVKEKTMEIADSLLSAISSEINRGAIIDARAVQANSKNKDYDEILLRKSKFSGDITIPASCVLISTNCIEVIKASCQKDKAEENPDENADGNEDSGEQPEEKAKPKKSAAGKPKKSGKK